MVLLLFVLSDPWRGNVLVYDLIPADEKQRNYLSNMRNLIICDYTIVVCFSFYSFALAIFNKQNTNWKIKIQNDLKWQF